MAKKLLDVYLLADGVYVLGSFENGVTVFNQQIRALNLAWAMLETADKNVTELADVAIVGGGIAGLTLAAGLLKKGVPKITIFERRAVLCPLQQGSDTRWIHPHIYEWPAAGTENPVAGLPIMNWKAGRASDVTFQILSAWERLKRGTITTDYQVQNDQNQIDASLTLGKRVTEVLPVSYLKLAKGRRIEWVCSSVSPESENKRDILCGDAREFSAVVLALGFGEESGIPKDEAPNSNPYWRNESFGQPLLARGTKNYIISGFGDGAIVDLCRIRISAFRQDRTLWDLFEGCDKLKTYLKQLKTECDANKSPHLYDKLAAISTSSAYATEFERALGTLRKQLRLDTSAVLATGEGRTQTFTDVFLGPASFQNRVLLYLLFRAGAFVPTPHDAIAVKTEYDARDEAIIVRHGTRRKAIYLEVLTPDLMKSCKSKFDKFEAGQLLQTKDVRWSGGYWDVPDSRYYVPKEDDKKAWRQEYLPPLTQAICSAIASAVAGLVGATDGTDNRVTLHRVIRIGDEVLLQQACEYFGNTATRKFASRRTFSVSQGTIGLAVRTGKICFTGTTAELDDGAYVAALKRDMEALHLGEDSMKMSPNVKSLLTVPFLCGAEVIAILYADSNTRGLFHGTLLTSIVAACHGFAAALTGMDHESLSNIERDLSLYDGLDIVNADDNARVLEIVQARRFNELAVPPVLVSEGTKRINFEITDFRV